MHNPYNYARELTWSDCDSTINSNSSLCKAFVDDPKCDQKPPISISTVLMKQVIINYLYIMIIFL